MADSNPRRTAARLVLLALALAAATAVLLARSPRAGGDGTARGEAGVPAGTAAASPETAAARPAPARTAPPMLREAAAWAGRGAWDSAAVVLTSYVTASGTRPDALVDAYALAAVGAWMGILGRDRAEEFARRPRRNRAGLAPALAAELAWLDGLLAFTDGDGRRVDEASLRIREADGALSTDLERSLRAFQLALDGDEVRAARLLRRLEEDRAGRAGGSADADDDAAFLTPLDRIAAAHWFIRNGRSDDGIELLEPPERALPPGGIADIALRAFVHLERARAQAAMGAQGKARDEFREFLRRYDLPEGPARGWAREALADDASPGGR